MVTLKDLAKLSRTKKKEESDEEEVDNDFNPYLDPEDREPSNTNGNDDGSTDETTVVSRFRSSVYLVVVKRLFIACKIE